MAHLKLYGQVRFNIHFSVLTNFVMIAYLAYFFNLILFRWISVVSLNFCSVLLWLFTRHFKGHLEIFASALYKSHYPESFHQHSISNGIGTSKILFFSYKFFFGKKYNIYIRYTSIFFLLFSYSASISLTYTYNFCTVTYFSGLVF